MALSGNFERKVAGGSTGGYYIGVDWKINSQNTNPPYSNITASVYVRATGSGYTISSTATKNITITIDGTQYTGTNTIGVGTNVKKTLLTKTVNVNHNSDGTKSCPMACSVQFGFSLSGTSLGTESTSSTVSFDKINVNSAPVMSGSLNISPSGAIAENIGTINLSWTKATDAQNNANKYRIERFVGGTLSKTFEITNINTTTFSDTEIGGVGQGSTIYYQIFALDTFGATSNGLKSSTITKNSLTGASFTGHSNDVGATTTQFELYVDGAKNTNGNTTFNYYYYSDDITVYNAANTTSKTGVIKIWRDTVGEAQPSGMYIKLSDLVNKFKNQSYSGRLHVGVRTTNAYGSQKWSGGSIGVELRSEPIGATPVISEDMALSTALKQVKSTGNKYYLPNGTDKIRIAWSGGKDNIGQTLTYDVQIKIGNGGYETKASGQTGSYYDLVLPKQSISQQIVARVITKTVYGNNKSVDSTAKTLHYYNPPSVDLVKMDRKDETATATIKLKANTSIPNINFPTRTYSGISSGTLSNTTNEQNITATGLKGENKYTWTITVNDDTGFTSANQTRTIEIPSYIPLMCVREKGVGINAIPDGSANLMVNGMTQTKGLNISGYRTPNTGGDYVGQWTKIAILRIPNQYGDAGFNANFTGSGNGEGSSTNGRLVVRIKQQNPMGQSPSGSIYLYDGIKTDGGCFKMIITANTTSETVAEIWFKNITSYESVAFSPLKTYGTVSFIENFAYQTTLPSGAQISCNDLKPLTNADVVGGNNGLYGKVMKIGADGIMEAGKYLDFHDGDNGQDYSARITCGGANLSCNGAFTANRMYNSNWYYSSGATGWYNETHGGGWYMTDSTWMRSYNNKAVYSGGNFKTSGRFEIEANGKVAQFGTGAGDLFIYNNKSNKYLQMKDNGVLAYSDSEIYHVGNRPKSVSLYSGTLSGTASATLTNAMNYAFITVIGRPGSASADVGFCFPVNLITGSTVYYQITTEASYIKFGLYQSGNNIVIVRNAGSGNITKVYGG